MQEGPEWHLASGHRSAASSGQAGGYGSAGAAGHRGKRGLHTTEMYTRKLCTEVAVVTRLIFDTSCCFAWIDVFTLSFLFHQQNVSQRSESTAHSECMKGWFRSS